MSVITKGFRNLRNTTIGRGGIFKGGSQNTHGVSDFKRRVKMGESEVEEGREGPVYPHNRLERRDRSRCTTRGI